MRRMQRLNLVFCNTKYAFHVQNISIRTLPSCLALAMFHILWCLCIADQKTKSLVGLSSSRPGKIN